MRSLTTKTRKRIENVIDRMAKGESITLSERIALSKYAKHIPFISLKINEALKIRKENF